jgi:hypothetical protein
MADYLFTTSYSMQTMLHAPVMALWIDPVRRYYEATCGKQATGALSVYYCVQYNLSSAIHNGDYYPNVRAGNVGQAINPSDATDFGGWTVYTDILTGGALQQEVPVYTLTAGDTIKNQNNWSWNGTSRAIDELVGTVWYKVTGPIDNVAGTYHIQCPVAHAVTATCPTPGAAFTGFTRNGVPLTSLPDRQNTILYRPDPVTGYNPTSGFSDNNYAPYVAEDLHGLKILGKNAPHALANFAAQGGESYYITSAPSQWWDDSVVVPGSP